MKGHASGRRRFLKHGAALAGLAAGAARPASAQPFGSMPPTNSIEKELIKYGGRSRFVTTSRLLEDGDHGPFDRLPTALTPLQDSVGIITPSPLHFVSSHGYVPPDIDPREHRLMIHGMVDRPLVFTVEELRRLPFVSRIHFIECQANKSSPSKKTIQESHGKTACSEWTGVPLPLLLKEAGVRSGASWIVAEGEEAGKHTKSLPLAKAMEDVLVAYGQNGEPIRPHQGYPLRLLVPGFEGLYNVKWLRRIKVVDQPYLTFQEVSRYTTKDPKSRWLLGPKSVITFPSSGQRLPGRGFYTISGLAWSGGGTIRRAEVSADGGRTWQDAQLHDPVVRIAHTRFSLPWRWNGEETLLLSRCTDDLGQVQPSLAEFAKFWESTPEKIVADTSGVGHFNVIQPWRIDRDGAVHNALL
jgi:sulfane dehydrogenase subunit SoxC